LRVGPSITAYHEEALRPLDRRNGSLRVMIGSESLDSFGSHASDEAKGCDEGAPFVFVRVHPQRIGGI
jgi:hypothetical protein